MSKAIALARTAQRHWPLEPLRTAIVLGCALALILVQYPLPL